jgi:hypothetical protein
MSIQMIAMLMMHVIYPPHAHGMLRPDDERKDTFIFAVKAIF